MHISDIVCPLPCGTLTHFVPYAACETLDCANSGMSGDAHLQQGHAMALETTAAKIDVKSYLRSSLCGSVYAHVKSNGIDSVLPDLHHCIVGIRVI